MNSEIWPVLSCDDFDGLERAPEQENTHSTVVEVRHDRDPVRQLPRGLQRHKHAGAAERRQGDSDTRNEDSGGDAGHNSHLSTVGSSWGYTSCNLMFMITPLPEGA